MKVYLHLFHGRNTVDEEMDDWGFNGPTIGPLDYVHTTYATDVKFELPYDLARQFFPAEAARHAAWCKNLKRPVDESNIDIALPIVEGLLVYEGKYYGDWSVSAGDPPGGFYRIDVIHAGDEVVHSERFDGTAHDAERKLSDVWNAGPWPTMEAGRYKAVLYDVGSSADVIVQSIEPVSDEEDEYPVIRDDSDWVDLDLGEEAIVHGRLSYIGGGISIFLPWNWHTLVIDCDDPSPLRPMLNQDIELLVTRTEDGLFATADAVTDALVNYGMV